MTGILDFAKSGNANSKVYGFVGGTKGLFDQQHIEITEDVVALYRNQVFVVVAVVVVVFAKTWLFDCLKLNALSIF